MQIQEVQKAKQQLERDIKILIDNFNKVTGVVVSDINFHRVGVGMICGDVQFSTQVTCEVTL